MKIKCRYNLKDGFISAAVTCLEVITGIEKMSTASAIKSPRLSKNCCRPFIYDNEIAYFSAKKQFSFSHRRNYKLLNFHKPRM
jgi:hypothetical protein